MRGKEKQSVPVISALPVQGWLARKELLFHRSWR